MLPSCEENLINITVGLSLCLFIHSTPWSGVTDPLVNWGKTTGHVQLSSFLHSLGPGLARENTCSLILHAEVLPEPVPPCWPLPTPCPWWALLTMGGKSTWFWVLEASSFSSHTKLCLPASFITSRGDILASSFTSTLFLNLFRTWTRKRNVNYWRTASEASMAFWL